MSEVARLRWLCRRGMKELDLLLQHYFERVYPGAPQADKQAFRSLLEMPDPELNDLILGRTQSGDEDIARVSKILRHSLSQ